MNDTKIRKIRTVSLNNRGQLVIPEDIRKDFGIIEASTLVLIERGSEIVLRKEGDVLEAIESDDSFWKALSHESMKHAWSKEDEVWNKVYRKEKK